MTAPCGWNDSDHRQAVELAWQSGYEFALWGPGLPMRLAAIDEVRALELAVERLTPEQQYRRRRTEIDAGAARAGADMAGAAARNRAHDIAARHRGGEHTACDLAGCEAASRAARDASPPGHSRWAA